MTGSRTRQGQASRSAGKVRLQQAQAADVRDRTPLVVDGDRVGVVHSKENIRMAINS